MMMKLSNTLIALLGLVLFSFLAPGMALADSDKKADPCADIKDADEKNICRAFEIEKTRTNDQRKNRYQNKDHSTYYCSLVKNKDKKVYCFAVISRTKSQCGNIIDADLEKQCNSKF